MIEAFILQYLSGSMGKPVFFGRHISMPPEYYAISKTDSETRNMIRTDTISVYSYAATEYAAANMNQQVIGQMLAMAEKPEICSVKLFTDFSSPDTEVKSPRYQAIFYVTYYESEV